MSGDFPTPPSDELFETTSATLVGTGILVFALFPLAIPLIALLIVAALPLLAVGLVLAAAVAPFALALILFRAVRRRVGTPVTRYRPESQRVADTVVEPRREQAHAHG